jgi:hypothetical protein
LEGLGLKAVEGRASEPVLAGLAAVAASAAPVHIQSLEEMVSSFLKYQKYQDGAQP